MAQDNNLLCDTETGVCEMPNQPLASADTLDQPIANRLKVVYFTDPICSSCWGIEPQLRKMKLEYGNSLEIEYRMGGLLPNWSYNSGGISKPSDVAGHWDEVSIHYGMPIDGDVWLEDPLDSSYPPSIAYKAAQMQDQSKADLFLREIREMVFLKKINIAKRENLKKAALKVGLDIKKFESDFDGNAKIAFDEDLKLARQFGVRGFPTMYFMGVNTGVEVVYGSRPYDAYEKAIEKTQPKTIKQYYEKSWESLFGQFQSLTLREFAELSETSKDESQKILNQLVEDKKLEKLTTKNGSIWTSIDKE